MCDACDVCVCVCDVLALAAPGDFRRVYDAVEVALLYEFKELLDLYAELLDFIIDFVPLRIFVLIGRGGMLGFFPRFFFFSLLF